MNSEEKRIKEVYPDVSRLMESWLIQHGQMPWQHWFARMGIHAEESISIGSIDKQHYWSTRIEDQRGQAWFEDGESGNWITPGWGRKFYYHNSQREALDALYEKALQLLQALPVIPQHYIYLGDKMTARHLKHWRCHALLQANGRTVRGRNGNMLVRFGNGQQAVVLGRLLRKIEVSSPQVLNYVPGTPHV